jgi:hypothetical protein
MIILHHRTEDTFRDRSEEHGFISVRQGPFWEQEPLIRDANFSDAWELPPPHCVLDVLGLLFRPLSTDYLNLGYVFQVELVLQAQSRHKFPRPQSSIAKRIRSIPLVLLLSFEETTMLCDTDERGASLCPSRKYARQVSKAICDCRESTLDTSPFSVTDPFVVLEARLMSASAFLVR